MRTPRLLHLPYQRRQRRQTCRDDATSQLNDAPQRRRHVSRAGGRPGGRVQDERMRLDRERHRAGGERKEAEREDDGQPDFLAAG